MSLVATAVELGSHALGDGQILDDRRANGRAQLIEQKGELGL
jgi:hypothetical protein